MKVSGFKKGLLAGTALVAVSGIMMLPSLAQAAGEFAADTDDSADGVYETDINTGSAWAANTGHDVRVDTNGTLLLTDGDVFGDGDAEQAAIAPAVTAKTLVLSDQTNDDAAGTVTIDGDIDVGSLAAMGLSIRGDGVDAAGDGADTLSVDINGNVDLGTGVLTIEADQATAGSDVTVSISGNVTASDVVLDAAAGGSDTKLVFDGTTAQAVTGTINGLSTGEGDIVVTNTSAGGVTFASAIGGTKTVDTITVNNTGTNVTATFLGNVSTANGISFGDNVGTDTNTLVFDTSGGAIAVNGAVAGGGAADTNNISIKGGNTVTSNAAWTSNIDGVTLSGTGTKLTTGGALTTTTVTVGAGSILNAAGGTVTSAVKISGAAGTVTLGDGIDITGTVDNTSGSSGVGVLTITDAAGGSASVVSGNVGGTAALSAITLSGAGTAQFDGTVAASTITASVAAGTLDFNDNVTGTVNLAADATADLAAIKTITGAVNNTSGANGAGTLSLTSTGGTTGVTGAVGSSNSLKQITLNGTGTAAFGSSVNSDDIDFAAAGTATFGGSVTTANGIDLANKAATVTFADGANLTGNISSTGGANGTLNFSGNSTVTGQIGLAGGTAVSAVNVKGADSTVNVSGASFMGALTTLTDATISFASNATVSGAITNGGGIRIAAGTTLTAGSFGGAGTYHIVLDDDGDSTLNAADFGSIKSAGAINLAAETVNFIFTGNVAEGTAVVLAQGGAPAVTALAVTDNSALLSATLTANGNNLELAVARAAITEIVSSPSAVAVGEVLDSLSGTTDPELMQVLDAAATAGSAEELEEVLEAAAPAVDGGAVAAGVATIGATQGITNTRLASLRNGEEHTGMVAGNVARGLQTWGQAFGSKAEQGGRDGVDGYDADTVGLAVGVDTEMAAEAWIFGAAFSYAGSDVSSKNANRSETDVETYQVSLYTNYDINENLYASGQFGYAFGDNSVTRSNVGGVTGLTATGDYDSEAITLRGEVGRDYKKSPHMTITPKVLANYVHYDADGYTETGAGGANLTVDSDAMQIFELGLGLDLSWLYQQGGGSFLKPRVHGGVRYDFIGDEFQTTSSFTGGGAAFRTNGFEPSQTTIDVGTGFTYYTTDNWELTADYDYENKEDYDSHAGVLRAGYRW